jgi:predicted RNase H-like nuclease (RuvC/YqgF family)
MFGRGSRREIRKLTAEVESLTQALRIARAKVEEQRALKHEWQQRAERFSDDRVAQAREITQLQLAVAGLEAKLAALQAARPAPPAQSAA